MRQVAHCAQRQNKNYEWPSPAKSRMKLFNDQSDEPTRLSLPLFGGKIIETFSKRSNIYN